MVGFINNTKVNEIGKGVRGGKNKIHFRSDVYILVFNEQVSGLPRLCFCILLRSK